MIFHSLTNHVCFINDNISPMHQELITELNKHQCTLLLSLDRKMKVASSTYICKYCNTFPSSSQDTNKFVVLLTARSFIRAISTIQVEVTDLSKLNTFAVADTSKLRCFAVVGGCCGDRCNSRTCNWQWSTIQCTAWLESNTKIINSNVALVALASDS